MTAADIAALVGGTVHGDPAVEVTRLASIEDAPSGCLTFLTDAKYAHLLTSLACAAAIVDHKFVVPEGLKPTIIRVDNAQVAFATVMATHFMPHIPRPAGVEPGAHVSPDATIGADVSISATCYVEAGAQIGARVRLYPGVYVGHNAVVGDDTVLFPNVVIGHSCIIGAGCIFHAGVIIGADGFGFARVKDQNHKIPQIGNVIIEDEVELGANCTIDRATLGSTIIRTRVKMDNMVHVAHNVEIGAYSLLAAQVGIAGSAKLGKGCLVGGQAAISPHIVLPDFTQVSGQAGMSKTIKKAGRAFRGTPAREIATQLKIEAYQGHLPELFKRLEDLEAAFRASQNGSHSAEGKTG